jgi:hypothetical protein
MFKFNHLEKLNMTYFSHFKMSMNYSLYSLKSSYYFFIHALYPDIYKSNGSNNIHELSNILRYNDFVHLRKNINLKIKNDEHHSKYLLIQKLKEQHDKYNDIHD